MNFQPDYARWAQLVDVPLPRWTQIRQHFPSPKEEDVATAVRRELARPEIRRFLQPGSSVALGVGSRGIASLQELIATTVAVLKDASCDPFLVPAMGSHGGATASGQQKLLAEYGITEAAVGAPIHSSMDVVEIGKLHDGLLLYFDKTALSADLIIPINRIKPHSSFRGPVESGLTKMLVIGFGKHAGATMAHRDGFAQLGARLSEAAEIICRRIPFRFGLATVENAHHQPARIEAVPATNLLEREAELLQLARQLMAQLFFTHLDVLVVDEIGKNISGTGMDPNVTGRFATALESSLQVNKIVVLNLTPESHGSAVGLGLADVTTERVIRAVDLDATWINCLTSTMLQSARLPIFMPTDRMAIQLAVKTCNRDDPRQVRMAWIRNTLELERIYVSEALWLDVAGRPEFTQLGALEPILFNAEGEG